MTPGQREEPAPQPAEAPKRITWKEARRIARQTVLDAEARRTALAEREAAENPGCGCDNDPIECNHEAALGEAEAALAKVRELLAGAACDGCALAEEISEVVDVPSPVQRRIDQEQFKAELTQPTETEEQQ